MRISRITVWQLDLPLREPYFLSGGRLRFDRLDSTIVRIDTDDGLSGWGEACPWGHTYLPAHGPGVRAGLNILAPAVIGLDPRSLDHLNAVMDVTLPGHGYVKSAIDMACWDIYGKAADMPLWQCLGGAMALRLINSSISTGTPEEMLALIRKASADGYKVHSAKIGGTDIALDIARIDAISSALPADESVTFDVNRAWQPAAAVQVLNAVASRDWVEQPCETLDQCAMLLIACHNPSCWMNACWGFRIISMPETKCLQWGESEANRLGGLTRARQVRDFGVSVGWQMHVEDVGGSALGARRSTLPRQHLTPTG